MLVFLSLLNVRIWVNINFGKIEENGSCGILLVFSWKFLKLRIL